MSKTFVIFKKLMYQCKAKGENNNASGLVRWVKFAAFALKVWRTWALLNFALIFANFSNEILFNKIKWITKKHLPPVFQPYVFPVYLRNRLNYKKIIYIFLYQFLKSSQLKQEFSQSDDTISWYWQKR